MATKDESTGLEWLLVLFIGFALMLPGWWVQGWVLTKMWRWFIVPAFGLQPPGIWAAVGLVLIVGYICPKADVKAPKRTAGETLAYVVGQTMFAPLIALFIGWLIHLMV